jgi:hypothetical protein
VLPVAGFFLLAPLVVAAGRHAFVDGPGVTELVKLAGTLFVVILLPWVLCHWWSLLVRRKTALGREAGQHGYGWLNSGISPDEVSLARYSYQLLVVLAAGKPRLRPELLLRRFIGDYWGGTRWWWICLFGDGLCLIQSWRVIRPSWEGAAGL